MAKSLIIVESPAKIKTISKFLGKDYLVEASVGHVRDLPKKTIGVDEENDFLPQYQIIDGKEKIVEKLRKAAKKVDHVYLAPDPDREGEAIAWHIAELIKDINSNISRIQFNEITAKAVKEALANPKPLDENLFDAQQARRILDRLVGYKISPILWKSIKRGISAGRVQSVALKIMVEREKEHRSFIPQEYWNFQVNAQGSTEPDFNLDLALNKKKSVKAGASPISSTEEAEALEKYINKQKFIVQSVQEKERKKKAPVPYITSTLQQDSSRRHGFSSKKTMMVAQKLYEGVELGVKGLTALITYMRTDSIRIAQDAQDAARTYILSEYGKEFCPTKAPVYKAKGGAQDAHEAIRPVDVNISPEEIKNFLTPEQFKLYRLIWSRFLASQMTDAKFHDTHIEAAAGDTIWRVKGERLLFAGYQKVFAQGDEDALVPLLKEGEELKILALKKEQKFTQAPARYSEAGLVKILEELGIGRPSTYAAIISTLQDREYVQMEEKRFIPTELGFTVSDQLSAHFEELMDVGFTANMESELDAVAEGKQNWKKLLAKFTETFNPTLEKARKDMGQSVMQTEIVCELCQSAMTIKFSKNGEFLGCVNYPKCKNIQNFTRDERGEIVLIEAQTPEDINIACEKCGKPMSIKRSRNGEFLGCTGYPACKNTKSFRKNEAGEIEVIEGEAAEVVGKCPACSSDLIIKKARTGSRFIACSSYPDCKHAAPFSTGVPCPEVDCDGELVEKSTKKGKMFYACSKYPKCQHALWDQPIDKACPECGHPILIKKYTKAKGEHIACPEKTCSYKELD